MQENPLAEKSFHFLTSGIAASMRMKKIFRQMARERGVMVRQVREEIQKAIAEAWTHPQKDGITAAYQKQVPCVGKIPTPEKLIDYLESRIQKQEVL